MPDLLEDILGRFKTMPEAELAELTETTLAATADMKWIPTPGPQTEAYFSKADLLFYGGSGGSGKSDLLGGLALTAHRRTLMMRRQYTDLGAIIERIREIDGSYTGFNGSPPPKLKTADGRVIDFGAAAKLGDERHWQGQAHDLLCVRRGTLVLMETGEYRAIEVINIGDMVQTLEGGRRVTKTYPVQRKDSVRVDLLDNDKVIASQVQSVDHELLMSDGWACLGSVSAARQLLSCESIQSRVYRKDEGLFGQPCEPLSGNLPSQTVRLLRIVSQFLFPLVSARPFVPVISASSGQRALGNDCGAFGGDTSVIWRLPLSIAPRVLRERFPRLFPWIAKSCRLISLSGGIDVRRMSLSGYSQESCSGYLRLHDEPLRESSGLCGSQEGVRLRLLRPGGVGQSSPTYYEAGGLGRIPRCKIRGESYGHPYTKDIRYTGERLSELSFDVTFVGVEDLCDIEVEEVNHYITDGGFINKNCVDEVVHFLEDQIRFLMGWVRTTDPEQRTRTVFASNPPDTAEGDWVIPMFRPWLDDTHHNPAKPGELRWFVSDPDGKDFEVDGPELYQFPGDEKPVIPHSRTFIPAKLDDNPFLRDTGYQATLDALQGDLRAAVRDGDFMAARMDNPAQMIPTAWIRASMNRWEKDPPSVPMSCIAVDPSAGGKDKTTISSRYDGWFSKIIELPGKEVPLGKEIAGLVIMHRCDGAPVVVDMGGGYGGVPFTTLQDNGIQPHAHKGVEASNARSADRKMGFFNKRTEIWWRFMEALDPDQKGGSGVDLPDDQELLSDLTSVRFTRIQYKGVLTVKAETKEEVVKRLGRSPDKGDAVTMCWSRGEATVLGQYVPRDQRVGGRMGRAPKVVTSKSRQKR